MAELDVADPLDRSQQTLQAFIEPHGVETAERRPDAVALRDWLFAEARLSRDPDVILAGFAERLEGIGVPVERISYAIRTLHSDYAAVMRAWKRGAGVERQTFPHTRDTANYERSPFFHVHQTGTWLELWLPDTPDERFGVVPELKAQGYTHYLCFPVVFANGDENGIAFATKAPGGFGKHGIELIRFLVPPVAMVMEITAGYLALNQLLRIYIGDEPHQRVLAGDIRRGQVTRIRSAIFFADMRSYTRITSTLTPEAAVDLLNLYFDCLVPPVEAEGGEVLKYMGDGLLAIFRDRGDDLGAASQSALTAAVRALARIEAANGDERLPERMAAGIALHHGEAAYGNVGSGQRLDFTVIGRDVNLASRIASLNKVLGEPILMSKAFVEHLWGDPQPVGRHALDGFSDPVPVYKPQR